MAIEIERKFLVCGDFRQHARKSLRIIQGYLNSDPHRTVRVRVKDEQGFITIKGIGSESGASRFEWEKEITLSEALELIKICEKGVIDKTRHLIDAGTHTFEVDEFYGDNEGLILAEIELSAEDEAFEKPEWLGEEVTGDPRYYNSMLAKNPFKTWEQQ